jgi:hypothetical protein
MQHHHRKSGHSGRESRFFTYLTRQSHLAALLIGEMLTAAAIFTEQPTAIVACLAGSVLCIARAYHGSES